MRCYELRFGVLIGFLASAMALVLAGCGSPALTTQPSANPAEHTTAAPPTNSPDEAFTSAVTKLRLIAQDGCQTSTADQIYPNCDRFLAELRSAAGTIGNNATGLPGGAALAKTAAAVLTGAATFDRDGCGGGPSSAASQSQRICVADLTRIRQGVSSLLEQTKSERGTGG